MSSTTHLLACLLLPLDSPCSARYLLLLVPPPATLIVPSARCLPLLRGVCGVCGVCDVCDVCGACGDCGVCGVLPLESASSTKHLLLRPPPATQIEKPQVCRFLTTLGA